MVSAIGSTGIARPIVAQGEGTTKGNAAKKVTSGEVDAPASAPATTAAGQIVAAGAPIDTAKVSTIRTALANGSYRIDPKAISARMMALDLPA